jgi:hypothetical protein
MQAPSHTCCNTCCNTRAPSPHLVLLERVDAALADDGGHAARVGVVREQQLLLAVERLGGGGGGGGGGGVGGVCNVSDCA